MDMKVHIKKIIFAGVILFMSSSFVFADEDRHLTVDREVGGMESHIAAPKGTPNPIVDTHKTIGSSQGTKKAGAGATVQPVPGGENHGNIYTNTGQTNNPAGPGADDNKTGTSGFQQTQPSETQSGETQTGTTETGGSVDTGHIGVEAGTGGTGHTSEPSAESISNPTQEATSGTSETSTGSGGAESGAGHAGSSNNPIVETDVNVNPESGTVGADATVDTSGELEDKQILDADLTAGETTSTEAEVRSAADVTQSDTVQSTDITIQPVSTVTTTSGLTAEVDTTGETTGGESDVGIEADVSGMSEGEDVTCDPVDGLTSSAACADLKL